jgi:hypothetical protein
VGILHTQSQLSSQPRSSLNDGNTGCAGRGGGLEGCAKRGSEHGFGAIATWR